MAKKKKFETEAVRIQAERSQFLEHSVPLYLTSSFVFEDAEDMRASFAEEKERNIYSRFSKWRPCCFGPLGILFNPHYFYKNFPKVEHHYILR